MKDILLKILKENEIKKFAIAKILKADEGTQNAIRGILSNFKQEDDTMLEYLVLSLTEAKLTANEIKELLKQIYE